jgi:hypothetical protein
VTPSVTLLHGGVSNCSQFKAYAHFLSAKAAVLRDKINGHNLTLYSYVLRLKLTFPKYNRLEPGNY